MADLDWDRNFALEQSGDDEEMLAELLVLFHDSAASDLAQINIGLAAEDAVAVADAAHSIKGASASLGVESVRRIAHELEKNGRSRDLSQAGGLVAQLTVLLKEFQGLH
ncbi:MAG TPA: histidine kinase [Desulfobulbaceae bacterium]|nr:MAG: histidine kinase [Deltaproteobacteria bacterium RIFOXYD12_FULL_53_23]HCC54789.1 histidine kinase [Desulfobulbaceae bacterium]